jgi:hypothetical protein
VSHIANMSHQSFAVLNYLFQVIDCMLFLVLALKDSFLNQ